MNVFEVLSRGFTIAYSIDQTVYRGARNKSWIKGTTVKNLAFLRRKARDSKGLSVSDTPADAVKHLREHFGIIHIRVGDVRNIGLDVIPDPQEENKGNINTSLPYFDSDDTKEVEQALRLAGVLANSASPYTPTEI